MENLRKFRSTLPKKGMSISIHTLREIVISNSYFYPTKRLTPVSKITKLCKKSNKKNFLEIYTLTINWGEISNFRW